MNTFSGWSCTVGAWWALGTLPSSTEGTEKVVFSWTLVAFGYHVPPSRTNAGEVREPLGIEMVAGAIHEDLARERVEG